MAEANTVEFTLASLLRGAWRGLGGPWRRRSAVMAGTGVLRWAALRRIPIKIPTKLWGSMRRHPRRAVAIITILSVIVAAVMVLTFVSAPYYALYPGDVYSATGAVSSESEPTYEPMSLIGFVTISARPTDSLWQWLAASLDDSASLQHEDVFNRGLTPQERRNTDARLMTRSQDVSVYVALRELGYELPQSQVVVSGLIPCMPAAEHIAIGDVITSVDGEPVTESSQVSSAVRSRSVGEVVEFGILRQGEGEQDDEVVLADIRLGSSADECIELPTRTSRADERPLLGVILANHFGDLGVDINFATGNIAGPSAGLAFTLSVMDLLTPGEITEGRAVAATGTVSPDGSVGTVGGIAQKVRAVESRNFRLMLVPEGQYEEAVAAASDELEIVEVASVAEALAVIAPNWSPPQT